MVVEDEWGDIVAYGSIACDSVEQTARDAAYRTKIRECYPKVSGGVCCAGCGGMCVCVCDVPPDILGGGGKPW